MGWYIKYHYKGPFISTQSGAMYGHAINMDMRTQRQHSIKMWYGGVKNGRLRHKQLARSIGGTRHAHTRVAYCCCCAAGL